MMFLLRKYPEYDIKLLTSLRSIGQSGRPLPLGGRCRWFESIYSDQFWDIAQLVEQRTVNPLVTGSSPVIPAKNS
jgi:hypothetical protein